METYDTIYISVTNARVKRTNVFIPNKCLLSKVKSSLPSEML